MKVLDRFTIRADAVHIGHSTIPVPTDRFWRFMDVANEEDDHDDDEDVNDDMDEDEDDEDDPALEDDDDNGDIEDDWGE